MSQRSVSPSFVNLVDLLDSTAPPVAIAKPWKGVSD